MQSSWSLISGAESASFRVGSGQAGKYLRGVFSYTDSGGTRERVFAQSEEVVRRKSLPAVVVPIFGGEKESSSSSVSVSEEGEALEMVSRSLSQAQERLSLMRNRRSSGSGTPSLPPPRFSLPPVLSEPRVQPPSSQGSGAQIPQSPQAQGTTTQQSGGASSQPSSQPPGSQGGGAQIPQSPQAQGTSRAAKRGRIVAVLLSTSRLAGRWGANSAEPTTTRYERAAKRGRTVSAFLSTSNLAGEWGASSAEPTSARYERAAERWCIVATFLATSNLAGEWGASSAEPTSARYERAAERWCIVSAFLATSNLAGEWGASSAEPTSARYERTAKRRCTVAAASVVGYPFAVWRSRTAESPRRAECRRADPTCAKSRRGGRGGRIGANRRAGTQTPSPSTPISRKTDPLSDTELRKDLGGSELPTSVRLSPHDIHTEITFISEDEVDVQLSLAEGAPMEISVRALAAQLTGDDAVRIEILNLPEGLRFDRETGMLEDTLGSGLSADGVAEVRVMLTDAQGRRMTVTLQVLSAEGLSQPEAATKLEGRTQTGEQTGGGRPDVGDSSDGADEGEGSEGSDSVGDAALEELSGDKEAGSSSSGSAGALSSEGFLRTFLAREACVCGVYPTFFWIFSGDFFLRREIVLGRDISSGSADGDGEVSQTPSRSSLETQVAELGVHGRARSLVARLRCCLAGRAFSTREASMLRGNAIA